MELPLPPPPSISQSSTPLFLCLLLFRILSLKNSSPDLSRDGGEDNRLDANWDEDGVANNLLRWWFFLALSPEIRRKKFRFFIQNCYIMLKTKCSTVCNKNSYQKDLLGWLGRIFASYVKTVWVWPTLNAVEFHLDFAKTSFFSCHLFVDWKLKQKYNSASVI